MAQDLRFPVGTGAGYERPEETPAHQTWVTRFAADLADGTTGVYVGFLAARAWAGSMRLTPGATWDRLVEGKDRYDPTNLFRHNQNIQPSTWPPAAQAPCAHDLRSPHAVEQQFTQIARPRVEELPPASLGDTDPSGHPRGTAIPQPKGD